MTEQERLIAQNILPEVFFKEETRNGFFVDAFRKKIWAVQLDMLLAFDKICKKHGLKYFLMFGTLLGAVRHKGFIPWDDDVDVGMFRDDYEKLLTLDSEFKAPHFLQTRKTDSECFISYARIRNSNTTAISRLLAYQKMNHGIFMDIFPFDNLTAEEGSVRFDKIRALNIDNGTYMRMTNPHLDLKNQSRVKDYKDAHKNPVESYNEIQRLATLKNTCKTKYMSNLTCTIDALDKKMFLRENFETTVNASFENFEFPIPVGFESILSTSYGNYMEFPPLELRGTQHSHYLFDPDRPFCAYENKV